MAPSTSNLNDKSDRTAGGDGRNAEFHPPPSHAQSENQAVPHGPPQKQRKLNRTLPQLKRNAACIPCRRRRIKCDAGRPHCSSCVRSYHFLARTQPDEERDSKGVQCFYDDDAEEPDDPPARAGVAATFGRKDSLGLSATGSSPHESARGTKRKDNSVDDDPKEVIRKLEGKVAELQQALARTSVSSTVPSIPSSVSTDHASIPRPPEHTIDPNTFAGPSPSPFPINLLNEPYHPPPFNDPSNAPYDLGLPASTDGEVPLIIGNGSGKGKHVLGPSLETSVADDIDGEAGKMGGPFLELLWPGWPPKLPTPAMLDHLVETFFASVPSVPRCIHRQTFLTRLALPPTHPDFPHTSLLHAICAAAARYTAAVKCRPIGESIEKLTQDAKRANGKGLAYDDPAEETCFSERNAKYAMQAMRYEHVSPRGLLDMLQSQIIMGHWGQSNARWIEGWITIGGQGRLAICLGLFDHEPDDFGTPALRQSILPPPKSDAEREERRAVMYFILSYDLISSASSGWPNTLPTEELTTRMPSSRLDFDGSGSLPENPQYIHSPDLYRNHPIVDSFLMLVKGQILLGRACKFIRRCRAMEATDRFFAKELPEFKQIDSDIAAFNMSFPHSLRDPVQYMQGHAKGVDADLVGAHLVPRIASIFLHEPFADVGDPACTSAARILMEARACLNVVYQVVSSSADISYMVAPITSCDYLFTAARTILLFFQRALETGDNRAAYSFRSEIAVFKMAFSALSARFAMGARHLIMVEMMVRHVEEEVLGHPLPPEMDPIPAPLPAQPPAWHVAYPDMRRPYEHQHDPQHPPAPPPAPLITPQEAEKYYFTDTHPDGMAISKMNDLGNERHASAGGSQSSMSIQNVLDSRRGFVGSPMSASGGSRSGSSSNGPSPSNPTAGWTDMNPPPVPPSRPQPQQQQHMHSQARPPMQTQHPQVQTAPIISSQGPAYSQGPMSAQSQAYPAGNGSGNGYGNGNGHALQHVLPQARFVPIDSDAHERRSTMHETQIRR
ncbi:hypothetical protein I316_02368 [Kwoniella heveanensis BCC8398]|uniref:Zn(2)-C6 fungal-type domain-containing protein n=1 Tax=Kwoniella heveanensis BCC8398 TaxID=1296120 RepID=A0A1B9GY37_9TREE|nr:hypothetical protein I316_02368 [Kwoniella heveanensis BCC8398]